MHLRVGVSFYLIIGLCFAYNDFDALRLAEKSLQNELKREEALELLMRFSYKVIWFFFSVELPAKLE